MYEEYKDRRYVVFNVSELSKIDFEQVIEVSNQTIRKSLDETKTFIKWEGTAPAFVSNLTTKEGPYTHVEMLNILSTKEWNKFA